MQAQERDGVSVFGGWTLRAPSCSSNLAVEAIDRQAHGDCANRIALRWLGAAGGATATDYSFAELAAASNKFANLLQLLDVDAGDRVFSWTGRRPETIVAALGTMKARGVFCALPPNAKREQAHRLLSRGRARVLLTTDRTYREVIADMRLQLVELEHILIVPEHGSRAYIAGTHDLHPLLDQVSDDLASKPTSPTDEAFVELTRGTTGRICGAVHQHASLEQHRATGELVFHLGPGDVFLCTACRGHGAPASYAMLAPLLQGATLVIDESEPDTSRLPRVLSEHHITVWHTNSSSLEAWMRADLRASIALPALRRIVTTGARVSANTAAWSERVLDRPLHGAWWQAEVGAIVIGDCHGYEYRPGSMGVALPNVDAAVARRRPDGHLDFVEDGVDGELVLRRGLPSMFSGYLDDVARPVDCYADEWYLTGDLVVRDREGHFWYRGRLQRPSRQHV